MTVRFLYPEISLAISVVVDPESRMIVSPSWMKLTAFFGDGRLFGHVALVLKRNVPNVCAHVFQESAAVFAFDESFLFQPFQILPDGHFRYLEYLA